MTQGKHTPAPWRVFGRMTGKVISENAPGIVEICETGDFRDAELVPFNAERWNADAYRIAASVNACEGIPTEALEAGVVKDMLEALQGLLALYQGQHEYRETTPEEIAAEYAIARATGEKP